MVAPKPNKPLPPELTAALYSQEALIDMAVKLGQIEDRSAVVSLGSRLPVDSVSDSSVGLVRRAWQAVCRAFR